MENGRRRVGQMPTKRPSLDYEESCSDEDDDMDGQQQSEDRHDYYNPSSHDSNYRPKLGRPRKKSTSDGTASPAVQPVRRRGRGPSKRPCLNRNALMARENRQRKKEYIERIESKLQFYQNENRDLNDTIQKQSNEIKRLTSEVAYLKTVLNNDTMITTLLKSMNDSLARMHGEQQREAKNLQKPDVLNWVFNGQTNSSKTNDNVLFPGSTTTTIPLTTMNSNSEIKAEAPRLQQESLMRQTTNPAMQPQHQHTHLSTPKIARKTLPYMPKLEEDPPTVENILEDDDKKPILKSSSESASYCDYMTDKSSVGLEPTTPMSMISMDKGEASLSNTDFSQLSSFNVDLFNNFDDENPLQFEQDTSDFLNEDTLFHSIAKDPMPIGVEFVDPLEISKMSESLNEKNLFDTTNENAGVCLHINSTRVSLEYCSICHMNSSRSRVV